MKDDVRALIDRYEIDEALALVNRETESSKRQQIFIAIAEKIRMHRIDRSNPRYDELSSQQQRWLKDIISRSLTLGLSNCVMVMIDLVTDQNWVQTVLVRLERPPLGFEDAVA